MYLIKNGYMIDPASGKEGKFDIVIKEGKIAQIAETITPDAEMEVLDASNLIVAPGLIDTHSHFRDPGFTHKEDLSTGSAAAVKGGYTSVVLMANTNPAVDSTEVLTDILTRGNEMPLHVYSCANVTYGLKGEKITEMEALANAGAVGFTDDGIPILDEQVLKEALVKATALDLPVSLHEEDKNLIAQNGINRGKASAFCGIEGSPREAEYTLIDRDVQIAKELHAKLCVQHISTKEGVEIVRQARKTHPCIHAEATPQHFSITEDKVIEKGTLAKVNPPLRTEEDRLAIIEGLKDGTIDIIATDHAPHAAEEKAQSIEKAPSGMIGLETALSLAIRELVKPGHLTMSQMLANLTCNPAAFYKLNAGKLEVGQAADLVLFNPEEEWTVTDQFASKSANSPFIGETMPGVVHFTIVDGKIAYQK